MSIQRIFPAHPAKGKKEILYGFDGGPEFVLDLTAAIRADFLSMHGLIVDIDASNPSTPYLRVVRDLSAKLDVKVAGVIGKKQFRWKWEGIEKRESSLDVNNFVIYSYFKVIRAGEEVDRGMVVEPRGDRFYFTGLEKVYPAGGNYFPDVPVGVFEPLDVIQFGHSWD